MPQAKTTSQNMTDIGQLINQAFTFFGTNWKNLCLVSFLFMALPQLALTTFVWIVSLFATRSPNYIQLDHGIIPANATAITVVAILYLIIVIFSILGSIALIVIAKNPGQSFNYVLKSAWRLFFSYLWVSILVGLAILAGTMLFIIPGIIFGIWLSFAVYFVVAESKQGTEALKSSKSLVSGFWWAVLGRFIVLFFLIIGVSLTITFIPFLGSAVAVIVTAPFSTVYIYLMYQNLKTIKAKSNN